MTTYVRVLVGAERYAVPVANVQGITALTELTPVPGAARHVLGLHNLRGEILAVYDLAVILGLTESTPSQLLVTEFGVHRVGFAVDGVSDVGELPMPTEATQSDFLSGSSLVDGVLVGYLDMRALFTALEAREAV